MSKNVVVSVVTKVALFAPGTVEEQFVYALNDSDGHVVQSGTSADVTFTFSAVAPGTYTAVATKNGFAATAAVVVPDDEVSINVPDTISVTLA